MSIDFFFFSANLKFMKKIFSKFLILLFFIGINAPINSIISKNLDKNSIAYSYLCKSESSSDPQEKKTGPNCFFCIIKNNCIDDNVIFASNINLPDAFTPFTNFTKNENFNYFLRNSLYQTRSPPFTS